MRYILVLLLLLFSSPVYASTQGSTTGIGTWDLTGATVSLSIPTISGKVDRNNSAVNDDDCTGEQGLWWYDTTDSAFEFCNDNSGAPAVLGGGSGAPTDADYLVGTANGSLSAEIAVGTTPGGELGNTWASPTIDDTGITLTSITIGSLLGVDSIDATGAVDMDYGSVDITDHTFTSDGGTVILDGIVTADAFSSDVADPADAGVLRLGNAEVIGWEAAPASTDITLSVDSSEVMQVSGALNATALTEGTNAVYNSSETPGGELGGTWASPTIDDSITVTGWVMGASTATTPSADDNDTSLATTAYVQTELNAAGGRSVSCASGSCDADAELYTHTFCYRMIYPIATDDDKSIWANKTANDFLISEIWAESDQTVAFDLQVDDGTPADVNGTDITPAAGEAEDTSLSGDTTVAAGEELDLAITSVTNTPTWFTVCWTGTWVD